jgi:D-serine deaminase-like pyridoxal phosphate-dependent protein
MVDLPSPDRLGRALAPHLERLLTPALVIDLDAVEHNVDTMIARVGDARRWRPHTKTVKQSAIVRILMRAGVRSFKTSTVDELALVLGTAATEGALDELDVLLAYPVREPSCRAVLDLRTRYPGATVRVLADSPEHLQALAAWTEAAGESSALEAILDVDIGMNRTGSAPGVWQGSLTGVLDPLAAVRVGGVHGYDGHLAWNDRDRAHRGYDELCTLARALPDPADVGLVVTSGTHSFAHALAHAGLACAPWLHQVSPGTVVLSDLRSRAPAADLGLRQAAFVASRVISRPRPDRVTLDAGSKALSPDVPPPACMVLGWPHLVPLRASEEHGPVRVENGPAPDVGALLWLVPAHVCTTVNLHRRALWVRGDRMVGQGDVEATAHSVWREEAAAS